MVHLSINAKWILIQWKLEISRVPYPKASAKKFKRCLSIFDLVYKYICYILYEKIWIQARIGFLEWYFKPYKLNFWNCVSAWFLSSDSPFNRKGLSIVMHGNLSRLLALLCSQLFLTISHLIFNWEHFYFVRWSMCFACLLNTEERSNNDKEEDVETPLLSES